MLPVHVHVDFGGDGRLDVFHRPRTKHLHGGHELPGLLRVLGIIGFMQEPLRGRETRLGGNHRRLAETIQVLEDFTQCGHAHSEPAGPTPVHELRELPRTASESPR
ncbi:hypothetical protein ACU686_06345 [Yinghuangia aomiensis]